MDFDSATVKMLHLGSHRKIAWLLKEVRASFLQERTIELKLVGKVELIAL